jgi:small subunit ribosomal protein S20
VLNFIGDKNVANHKSAIKRDRQSKVQRLRNAGYKTIAKNAVKELRLAIANNKIEDANLSLNKTISTLQKVQSKGALHKNTASRKISRLTRQVNKLAIVSAEENKEEKLSSPKQDLPSSQS